MNNGISNQPYARAFFTEPMTAGIAFSPEEVDRMNALFSSKGTKTSATDGQFIDEKMRISDINFYYPNEQTAWIFEKLNYIIDFNSGTSICTDTNPSSTPSTPPPRAANTISIPTSITPTGVRGATLRLGSSPSR